MVEDMHQLPEQTAEAVHKTVLLAFQHGHGRLCLPRDIAGLLAEAPTPGPHLLGQGQPDLMLLGFPTRLALPAVGEPRFFEVPPNMLDRRAMGGLHKRPGGPTAVLAAVKLWQ